MTTRSADPAIPAIHFDDYAKHYDAALHRGLAATGETKDYFARGRIEWVGRCLRELSFQPARIMDFGCGDGSSSELLLSLAGAQSLSGVDTSGKSLELASRLHGSPGTSFRLIDNNVPREEFDLVYCNGVFHHIPLADRVSAAQYIWQSLRPGGMFAFWENNPRNPGSRYVMWKIPFDRDAIPLWPRQATKLVQSAGFEIVRRNSLFYFPQILKSLRWMEPHLAPLLFGGQYLLLCRKPERSFSHHSADPA